MSGYLDKEAVLKAVKDAFSNPEHIVGLLMRIERGEFDIPEMCCHRQNERDRLLKAVNERDAEIARLKEEVSKAKAEPHYPDGPWDRLHKANAEIADLVHANGILRKWRDNQIKHIAQLKDRIAQQDQELKDLTGRIKALDGWKRTNATYGSPGWSATASAFNEGIDRAIEVLRGNGDLPLCKRL